MIHIFHRPRLILWLIAAAGLLTRPAAADDAHYLDIFGSGVAYAARINGFPVAESGDGGSVSSFVTPLLKATGNHLDVISTARPNEQVSWLRVELAKSPKEKIRTASDPGEMIFSRRFDFVSEIDLTTLPAGAFDVIKGANPPGVGPLTFATVSPRRQAFGIRLAAGHELPAVPSSIRYSGLSHTLARAEIHFIGGSPEHHVVFKDLKLQAGGGTISLDPANTAQPFWLDDGSFNEIWIFGFSAEGIEKLELLSLKFTIRKSSTQVADAFGATVPVWAWTRGADPVDALADPARRRALVDRIRKIHDTLDSAPPADWSPYFETKLVDLAKALGRPEEAIRADQLGTFQALAATENWGLEPFDEDRLQLVPLNDHVVLASYVDSRGPIESVPIIPPGTTKPDRFTIPLYLAEIDGEWTVVR